MEDVATVFENNNLRDLISEVSQFTNEDVIQFKERKRRIVELKREVDLLKRECHDGLIHLNKKYLQVYIDQIASFVSPNTPE